MSTTLLVGGALIVLALIIFLIAWIHNSIHKRKGEEELGWLMAKGEEATFEELAAWQRRYGSRKHG